MHGPINVKYANNISKWLMGFNSAFKVLTQSYETGASCVGLRRGILGGRDYQCPIVDKEFRAYVLVVL
jgi:hypothetical protein